VAHSSRVHARIPTAWTAAAFALGGAKVSRLDDALVYKAQTAQSVHCAPGSLKLTGITSCDITAKPGMKLEDLEADVLGRAGQTAT
jgi:zinc protease